MTQVKRMREYGLDLVSLHVDTHHTHTHTSVAVTFEVIDGTDITVLAGFGLADSAGACAFTGLRTVFSHKRLFQL